MDTAPMFVIGRIFRLTHLMDERLRPLANQRRLLSPLTPAERDQLQTLLGRLAAHLEGDG